LTRGVWGQTPHGSGCGSAFDDPGDDPCHCLIPAFVTGGGGFSETVNRLLRTY
jgi:hypothetical protein